MKRNVNVKGFFRVAVVAAAVVIGISSPLSAMAAGEGDDRYIISEGSGFTFAEPEPEPEPTPEPEPVIDTNPVIDTKPEPVIDTNPVIDTKPEPVIDTNPVIDTKPEPVIDTNPVIDTKPEPVIDTNPVIDTKPEPVIDTEPVTPEPKTPEPQLELAPQKKTVYYTVTYMGAGIDTETSVVEDGNPTPGYKGTVDREGYTFEGWSPAVSATVTKNVVYKATWKKLPGVTYYTVTYEGNGISTQVMSVAKGDATPSYQGTLVREGFVFKGWSPAPASTVTRNAIYVAKWVAKETGKEEPTPEPVPVVPEQPAEIPSTNGDPVPVEPEDVEEIIPPVVVVNPVIPGAIITEDVPDTTPAQTVTVDNGNNGEPIVEEYTRRETPMVPYIPEKEETKAASGPWWLLFFLLLLIPLFLKRVVKTSVNEDGEKEEEKSYQLTFKKAAEKAAEIVNSAKENDEAVVVRIDASLIGAIARKINGEGRTFYAADLNSNTWEVFGLSDSQMDDLAEAGLLWEAEAVDGKAETGADFIGFGLTEDSDDDSDESEYVGFGLTE